MDEDNLDLSEDCDPTSSDKETIQATETIERMMNDDNLGSQIDLKGTSLQLQTGKVGCTKTEEISKIEYRKVLSQIEEKFSQRHHVATLKYSLNSASSRKVVPKFMHTNIELFPFYGSIVAKNFFKEKMKTVRLEVNQYVLESLSTSCDELIETLTDEAEALKYQLAESFDTSVPSDREALSSVQREILEMVKKWNTEYETFVKNFDDKLKRPTEAPKRKSAQGDKYIPNKKRH